MNYIVRRDFVNSLIEETDCRRFNGSNPHVALWNKANLFHGLLQCRAYIDGTYNTSVYNSNIRGWNFKTGPDLQSISASRISRLMYGDWFVGRNLRGNIFVLLIAPRKLNGKYFFCQWTALNSLPTCPCPSCKKVIANGRN